MQTKNTKFYLLQLTIFTKDRGGFTVFNKNNIQRYDTFTENADHDVKVNFDVISYEVETRSWSSTYPRYAEYVQSFKWTICSIWFIFFKFKCSHIHQAQKRPCLYPVPLLQVSGELVLIPLHPLTGQVMPLGSNFTSRNPVLALHFVDFFSVCKQVEKIVLHL